MSVLIKGIKMPTEGCRDCPVVRRGSVYDICPFLRKAVDRNVEWGDKPDDCPLVEVPTPHGPLIDEDVFIREINERIDAAIKWGTNAIADRENETRLRAEQAVATFCEASLTAKKIPTIIDAEEEKHG